VDNDNHSIHAIHRCENLFFDWIYDKLRNLDVAVPRNIDLSDVISLYEHKLHPENQLLKPLKQWDKKRAQCLHISAGDHAADHLSDAEYQQMLETTAFDGQVLWLTLKKI
jgi:hypothetical protein